MTICNYYHLVFKKVTRSYFAILILAKKEEEEYTSGTESGLGTLWLLLLRWIIENQKSDLVTQ